jgi:hypothetical protein
MTDRKREFVKYTVTFFQDKGQGAFPRSGHENARRAGAGRAFEVLAGIRAAGCSSFR